jgi:putative transposase
MANLSSRVTKASWPMVAALVRSIFEQPDRASTWDQLADVVDKLTEGGFVDVAERVLDAADEILAFTAFPVEHWVKIRSNNPQERLNKEIRRRTNVVGIFPNRASAIRLIGALLVEQTDEWAIGKRYMSAEPLNKCFGHLKVSSTKGATCHQPTFKEWTVLLTFVWVVRRLERCSGGGRGLGWDRTPG